VRPKQAYEASRGRSRRGVGGSEEAAQLATAPHAESSGGSPGAVGESSSAVGGSSSAVGGSSSAAGGSSASTSTVAAPPPPLDSVEPPAASGPSIRIAAVSERVAGSSASSTAVRASGSSRSERASSASRHATERPSTAAQSERSAPSERRDRVLKTGTRVKRGPDWKWHMQDGGPGKEGVVVCGNERNSDGWVRVKWDAGNINGYRWGAENAYDLELAETSPFSTAIRAYDVDALRAVIAEGNHDVNKLLCGSTPLCDLISRIDDTGSSEAPAEKMLGMVRAMISEFKADPNKISEGKLPLNMAAEKAHPELVKTLLELKADPKAVDGNSQTALQLALRCLERGDGLSRHAGAGGAGEYPSRYLSEGGSSSSRRRGSGVTASSDARDVQARLGDVILTLERQDAQGNKSDGVVRKFLAGASERQFGVDNPGFQFPVPAEIAGSTASFSVTFRIKCLEPTGSRMGCACVFAIATGGCAGLQIVMCASGQTVIGA
jgi:hypothetical protein